jgi:hypothetical protein
VSRRPRRRRIQESMGAQVAYCLVVAGIALVIILGTLP